MTRSLCGSVIHSLFQLEILVSKVSLKSDCLDLSEGHYRFDSFCVCHYLHFFPSFYDRNLCGFLLSTSFACNSCFHVFHELWCQVFNLTPQDWLVLPASCLCLFFCLFLTGSLCGYVLYPPFTPETLKFSVLSALYLCTVFRLILQELTPFPWVSLLPSSLSFGGRKLYASVFHTRSAIATLFGFLSWATCTTFSGWHYKTDSLCLRHFFAIFSVVETYAGLFFPACIAWHPCFQVFHELYSCRVSSCLTFSCWHS